MPSHAEIFDDIYRNNLWHGGSGSGSREEMTREYRAFLRTFVHDNQIASVVDLGCGDWQIARHLDWTGIDYTGVDVSSVVLNDTKSFAREGVRFLHANAVTDPLPAADLLIVKDVLQHWSNADILAFLPRLQNYRLALITNWISRTPLPPMSITICRPVFITGLLIPPDRHSISRAAGCFRFMPENPNWCSSGAAHSDHTKGQEDQTLR